MKHLRKLFEPIRIGSMTLPNRIIMPALTTFYDIGGEGRFERFYAERARGGVALVILGALQTLYPGRAAESGWIPDESVQEKGIVKINHDLYIPRLERWTRAVHEAGGKAAAQIATYGYWAKGGLGTPAEEVSPSGVRLEGDQYRPGLERLTFIRGGRPLERDEIQMIEQEVANAALRGKRADFDAIELQALGGNLISRFLSPLTNKRTDEYGGPLANRARMLLETTAAVKKKIGNDFPLICRINGDDLLEGGMKLEDYKRLAPMLESAGIHAIDIMPGWYETRGPVNQMCIPRGAFLHLAAGIKEVVSIPVAANIRLNDPVLAEQAIAEEKADLIAMCSPLIADPDLPNKAKAGRLEDIRMCTACCTCWSDIAQHFRPLGCSVNAQAGKESQYVIEAADRPRRIWVIGGGPAGMEAARVAALRGHRVTLFEKRERLGGQLLYADLPPHKGEWQTFVQYLETQLEKNGVEVRTEETVTPADVEAAKPDGVIVATGATPLIPSIPGVDGENVATAIEVLTEEKKIGQRVVIIGSGSVGCETAEFLVERGKTVTILEMLPDIGPDIDLWNRWVIMDRMVGAGIRFVVNTRAEEVTDKGVRARSDGRFEFFDADSVVLAVGASAEDGFLRSLEGKVGSLDAIGDCVKPQRVREAVENGFLAGSRV